MGKPAALRQLHAPVRWHASGPTTPGGKYGNRGLGGHLEEIGISSDQQVGATSDGGGEHPHIVRIAKGEREWSIGALDDGLTLQDLLGECPRTGRERELVPQEALDFQENNRRNDPFMLRQHDPQDIGRQPPGGEGAHRNVAVETNSHETSR
jgi:hypothetical protein